MFADPLGMPNAARRSDTASLVVGCAASWTDEHYLVRLRVTSVTPDVDAVQRAGCRGTEKITVASSMVHGQCARCWRPTPGRIG